MNVLERVPRSVLVIAIVVSLFLNVVNVNLTNQVADNGRANAKVYSAKALIVCGQISGVVDSINAGRDNNRTLYKNLLADALSRLNTPRELPSDRANIATYNQYVSGFPQNLTVTCKVLK